MAREDFSGEPACSSGPLAPFRAALQSAQRDLGGRLSAFTRNLQHHVNHTQDSVGRAVQHVGRQILTQQSQRHGALSMLAVSGSPYPSRNSRMTRIPLNMLLAGIIATSSARLAAKHPETSAAMWPRSRSLLILCVLLQCECYRIWLRSVNGAVESEHGGGAIHPVGRHSACCPVSSPITARGYAVDERGEVQTYACL